ncbi:MAG: hypothetical protein H8E30_18775 [Alphaproteobacteria bacterium]|nr:hypothetical protein [Alphaproteobacteria bacterium]
MRMLPILLFTLLSSLPGLAVAASGQDAATALAAAKSLRCVFKSATETNWEVGAYQTRPTTGFSFSIDAIKTAQGNAKAVSREGATHLEMIALSKVRHFLGFAAGGDLNVTTVHGQFAGDEGGFLASHSVHMASQPPITFQYFGNCLPISKN